MSLIFSPSMCVCGSLCVLGMAIPFRKVSEHFGVSGYISRWGLGWCDSWSLLVQEVGRGQWLMPLRKSQLSQHTGLTVPRAVFPRAIPAEQMTAASPLGISQGPHTDLHRSADRALHRSADTEVTGPPIRQLLELVVTGWLLKIFFKPMERSGQPCSWPLHVFACVTE